MSGLVHYKIILMNLVVCQLTLKLHPNRDVKDVKKFTRNRKTMTPKEKSEELVSKYKPYVYPYIGSSYMTGDEYPEQILNHAKHCALIAVDEIIKLDVFDCNDEWSDEDGDTREYWREVKQEIEKL